MADISKLIGKLVAQEGQLRDTNFLAPCLPGGSVRTRVAGLIYTFAPEQENFEGWGVFQPVDEKRARLVEEADLPLIGEYLRLFKSMRLRLAYTLQRHTWLAYPINESDARQRWGATRPLPIHLVVEGAQFEQIVARHDGGAWWFEEIDRRADPEIAERLRAALREVLPAQNLHFPNITPEMRTVYEIAAQREQAFQAKIQANRDETRLREALQVGGGILREFHDRGDFWLVEWTTGNGQRHSSAIAKRDLTVISSGICLSGRDRDFDLQSLVGVIEHR
ncbi:MAG: hypothetical protein AB1489_00525 [Acidobacteriota bacterium]